MSECLFCNIAAGEVQADLVYSDGDVVAFRDIEPAAPVHVLVVPRKHIAGYNHTSEEDEQLLGHVARIAAHVAHAEGVAGNGFRCVVNNGEDARQSVRHLHMHVLGGRKMGWPPG